MEQSMGEEHFDPRQMYNTLIAGDIEEINQLHRLEWLKLTVSNKVTCMDGRFLEACKPLSPDQLDMLSRGVCECVTETCQQHVAVSPLHVAVHSKNPFAVIEHLLSSGFDVNAQTLLMKHSIIHGLLSGSYSDDYMLEMMDFLLGKGFDVSQRDAKEGTLLHACILYKQLKLLVHLLENTEITSLLNARDSKGFTALRLAVRRDERIARYLLTLPEIDVNMGDYHNQTPLFVAIEARMPELTDLLLELGADVNQKMTSGYGHYVCTPLLLAVQQSDGQLVEKLLKRGADANGSSLSDHTSPLMIACYRGSLQVATLLIEYGAEVNVTNEQGYGAIHIAAWDGYDDLVSLFIENGVEYDSKTVDGNTPLSLACHGDQLPVVRHLLTFGCSVNNRDKDTDMPLHYATYNACFDTVKALCERGAEADTPNRFNTTPLWNAAYKGHKQIVRYLLQFNPEPNLWSVGIQQDATSNDVSRCFSTPRSVLQVAALSRDSEEIVKVLLLAGVKVWEEKWIFEAQSRWLLSAVHETRSLLMLCRAVIRDLLRGHGTLKEQVDNLPIPYTLKSYLTTESLWR